MANSPTSLPIAHHAIVDAAPAQAFDLFTRRLGAWWPLAYTFSLSRFADAAVDERANGEWYEVDDAGQRRSWGSVRVFDRPSRVVLSFAIGPDRQPTPAERASEVEVRFTDAGSGRTRVDVEHRGFDRHGDGADTMRSGMDSAQGWPLMLAEFRRWVRNCARPS